MSLRHPCQAPSTGHQRRQDGALVLLAPSQRPADLPIPVHTPTANKRAASGRRRLSGRVEKAKQMEVWDAVCELCDHEGRQRAELFMSLPERTQLPPSPSDFPEPLQAAPEDLDSGTVDKLAGGESDCPRCVFLPASQSCQIKFQIVRFLTE